MQRMLYEKIRRQDGVAQGSKEAMSLHSPSPLMPTREKREKMDKDRGETTKKNITLKKKIETWGEKCQRAIKRKMKQERR